MQIQVLLARTCMHAPSVGIQQQSVPTPSYLEVGPGRPLLQGGRESRGLHQPIVQHNNLVHCVQCIFSIPFDGDLSWHGVEGASNG